MTSREELNATFQACRPLFVALGDEVRLEILAMLMGHEARPAEGRGMNVAEITERTHLSRPAISHHLKVLKEAGLISLRSEGTSNYYYPTTAESTKKLMQLGFQLQERNC